MRLIDADELIKSIEYEVNRLNSAMYYALQHDMFATRANLKIQKNTLDGLIDEIEKLPSAERDYKFDEWCTECKEYDKERHCCPRFNHVIRTAIDDIVADRKKEEWIPCSERLPEEGKEVLISSDGGLYIAELEILEGNVYWNETIEYRSVKRVSAWMPLPKPYEAERKEE